MADYINYINGRWEKGFNSKVPINDAGFLLGDGLFETIRFDNRTLFNFDKHLKRLSDSLNFIRIKLNKSNLEIKTLLKEIIRLNYLDSGLIRLMITRGVLEGPPWRYDGPEGIYITIRPLTKDPQLPVKVIFYSENNYPIIRFTPAIKSLNYIGNMLAKKDADNIGAYEPVFYNSKGFITECAIRNIFFIQGNNLLTPDTSLGVLPGVMRQIIISIAIKNNLKIIETNISIDSINDMDEAFVSSTGIGLFPCYWEGWSSKFKITYELKNTLDLLIHNDVNNI